MTTTLTGSPDEPLLCDRCEKRPIAPPGTEAWQYDWCEVCYENEAEAWNERMQEGECFRGGEAEAYYQEQHEKERRLK